jgi:recombination protein RecT
VSEQIAKAGKGNQQIGDLLQSRSKELAKIAGKAFDVKKLFNLVLVAASRNPDLLKCTPASFLQFCIRCAETGTQTIGPGGAWPVPFNNKNGTKEIVFIADYRRLGNAAIEGECITRYWTDVVYSSDTFVCERGLEPKLEHTPAMGDRGKRIGAYCAFKYPDGEKDFVFMPEAEIQKVKRISKTHWASELASSFEDEFAKKSAVRRAMKPFQGKNPILDKLIETDDASSTLIDVTPIQQPRALEEGKKEDAPTEEDKGQQTDAGESEGNDDDVKTVECTITEVRDRKGKGPFKIGTGGEGPFEIWDDKLAVNAREWASSGEKCRLYFTEKQNGEYLNRSISKIESIA